MAGKFAKRFRYSFDNAMSKGLLPLIGLLSLITAFFIVLITALVTIFGLFPAEEELSWGEVAWRSLLRTLDAGTMAQDSGLGFRIAMLAVTLFGVVLVAGLIGIISNALSSRIDQLRRGKSLVLERNHTVLLGWNSKAIQIIGELVVANASNVKSSIVILSNRDKLSIEEEIHQRIKNLKNTRVVVRSGDPMSRLDLQLVAISEAKSIVILSPDFSEDADSFSIKTCLALKNLAIGPRSECSIVGEIRRASNLEAAELVGQGVVHWVLGEDLINRLIAQSCKQGGLSGAFTDILDFDGSEIYTRHDEKVDGKSYREVNLSLRGATLIGIIRNGEVILNPEADLVLSSSDELIVLAEDDSSIVLDHVAKAEDDKITAVAFEERKVERTLILGSNSGLSLLLDELDRDLLSGSEVCVVSNNLTLNSEQFGNFNLSLVIDDPTSRQVLEAINPASFDHIIILATREGLDVQAADARTLLSLLHVRVLTEGHEINIVTEILDDHNRELVEINRVDDFIVSDKIVSHAIAQLSENRLLQPIFNELFSTHGPSLSMMPMENYVKPGEPVSFSTVLESAHRLGHSAVGYRSLALKSEPGELHGVRLNPPRNQDLVFQQGDNLIVLKSSTTRVNS